MKKKICRWIVFVITLLLAWGAGGICLASEYIAKGGEDCAKAAESCGCVCDGQQMATMNKIADPKAPLAAGQKLVCLSEDEVDQALKYLEKRKKELDYGTGEFTKIFGDWSNLKDKPVRIEYIPDEQYPYGIRFTEVLEYAELGKGL